MRRMMPSPILKARVTHAEGSPRLGGEAEVDHSFLWPRCSPRRPQSRELLLRTGADVHDRPSSRDIQVLSCQVSLSSTIRGFTCDGIFGLISSRLRHRTRSIQKNLRRWIRLSPRSSSHSHPLPYPDDGFDCPRGPRPWTLLVLGHNEDH